MRFFIDSKVLMGDKVHPSLANRRGAETKQFAADMGINFGDVAMFDNDTFVVDADVSHSTPQRVLEFCEHMGVPRADFSHASDFQIYAGGRKSPLALQIAECFAQNAIDKTMLEELTPDELYQRAQQIANEVLDASDRAYADHGQDDFAVGMMKAAGIKVPDGDSSFLDPAPEKPFLPLDAEFADYADGDGF